MRFKEQLGKQWKFLLTMVRTRDGKGFYGPLAVYWEEVGRIAKREPVS
jgi:hypothetical protein